MKIIRKILYPITIVLILFIIVCIVFVKINLKNKQYKDIEIESDIVKENTIEEKEEIKEEIIKYHIDIKGAINNPGVYELSSDLTVNDAIKIAGGLTKDADTSVINLAKKITDEMVIIIYNYNVY